MPLLYSTYYGLTRISEIGPEVKGWSTTDDNFQTLSLILKSSELHQHGGATPIKYPGYNDVDPATPVSPTLYEFTTGGALPPGSAIGVRLAYLTSLGLETESSPEATIQLQPAPLRPNSPIAGDASAAAPTGLVTGGSYLYALTKLNGTSETDISDVTSVSIPFDPNNTYLVPLTFDPMTMYTDGTNSLRLYRSTGYGSSFQLLKTITDVNQTTYTDNNTIEDSTIQPPASNEFNQFEKVNIDWSTLSHPGSADTLRVYVTREIGLWDVNHLLAEWPMQDPATPLPGAMDYLGSEILAKGWPKDLSQLPANPPKVNLGTDAIGGPILTSVMDFKGYQSWNFVLANNVNNATPIDGGLYYDPSIPALRARVKGQWLNLATPGAGPAQPYVHPTQEQGGHSSDNILYKQLDGPTVTTILNTIATPVAKYRKPVTKVYKPTATPVNLSTTSSSSTYLVDMDTGNMAVDFAGQWVEVNFGGHFFVDLSNVTLSAQLEIDGISIPETLRSWTSSGTSLSTSIHIVFATPASLSNTRARVRWWTSGGTLSSITPRRTLIGKVLF